MILPKVVWTILKIIYERIYIKLLNCRQRAVHKSVWRLFVRNVETKVYKKPDIELAPINMLIEEKQTTENAQEFAEEKISDPCTSCRICHQNFSDGDQLAVGPCDELHQFHLKCLT